MQFSAFIVAAFASTLVAGRAFEKRNTDVYATFYSDDACTQNQGSPVDTTNPGCLNEGGRQSIYFQSATSSGASLVISPGSDCPCQSGCIGDIATGDAYCYNLNNFDGAANAPSYRFIGDPCGPNNC